MLLIVGWIIAKIISKPIKSLTQQVNDITKGNLEIQLKRSRIFEVDDLVHERQLELALEGHRFFDLVRWNKTDLMIDQPLHRDLGGEPQSPAFTCQFTPGINEFFPLPQAEVINSNGNLKQYTGY